MKYSLFLALRRFNARERSISSVSFLCFFAFLHFLVFFSFWAAAPKESMTYAFTEMGNFLLLLLLLLLFGQRPFGAAAL